MRGGGERKDKKELNKEGKKKRLRISFWSPAVLGQEPITPFLPKFTSHRKFSDFINFVEIHACFEFVLY